jgi:hypothetical protein
MAAAKTQMIRYLFRCAPDGAVADICCKIGRPGLLVIEAKSLTTVPKMVLMGSVHAPGSVAAAIAANYGVNTQICGGDGVNGGEGGGHGGGDLLCT